MTFSFCIKNTFAVKKDRISALVIRIVYFKFMSIFQSIVHMCNSSPYHLNSLNNKTHFRINIIRTISCQLISHYLLIRLVYKVVLTPGFSRPIRAATKWSIQQRHLLRAGGWDRQPASYCKQHFSNCPPPNPACKFPRHKALQHA